MQQLRVDTDGATLAATYTPAGDTALVAVHGAAEGTRDTPFLSHIQAVLPQAGVGVVTFDRRGEGESTGDVSRGRFEQQACDALAVLGVIDAPRRGLLGYSQGGWVAPIAAAGSPEVQFLVVVASAGVTPAMQMMYATERQLRLGGYDEAIVARALNLRREFAAWAHQPNSEATARLGAALSAAQNEEWFGLLFLPASVPGEDARRSWLEEMDFDPVPTFARVQVPTLALWGENDSWTPVAPSVAAWQRACPRVETVVIPNAEHDLSLPDGTFADEFGRAVSEWLRRRES